MSDARTPTLETMPAPAGPTHAEESGRAAAVHGPLSPRGAFVRLMGRRGALIVGAVSLAVILLASIFANWITPYDPITQNLRNTLRPPSWAHPFGTDNFGRDVFSRVLHAAKLDVRIGFFCVLFPWILGSVLGAIAGYVGGIVDTIVMRTVDTFTAFPFLIMAIGVIAVLGPGITSMYIALTLSGWSIYARIVRAEVLVARKSEYVLAARALGYNDVRILLRHILPNVITPTVIFAMTSIVLVILSTVTLSFLGLGVPPPTPTWGTMIAEGKSFIFTAWWMVTLPGLAIVVVGLALSLLGDGVADVLRGEGSR
jgi:peptide/nickel transport system permease protein